MKLKINKTAIGRKYHVGRCVGCKKMWHCLMPRKFCSNQCRIDSRKGKKNPEHSARMKVIAKERGFGKWMVGRTPSMEIRAKQSATLRGIEVKDWNGFSSPLDKLIRRSKEYVAWRTEIFERDKYTCQECGVKNHKGLGKTTILAVDHYPKPFSQIIKDNNIQNIDEALTCDELWDIKNNRTLCVPCHKKTDTFGWKIYNNFIRESVPLVDKNNTDGT